MQPFQPWALHRSSSTRSFYHRPQAAWFCVADKVTQRARTSIKHRAFAPRASSLYYRMALALVTLTVVLA